MLNLARRTSSVSLPPPSSPPSVIYEPNSAAAVREPVSPAQTLWTAPSPTQTLGHSSPELPTLPSLSVLGGPPRTPSTVARQDRTDTSYYTASWGSPYRHPPPSFNGQRHPSTQFGSDDLEGDSGLQFGLEHLLPPTLVQDNSPNQFNLEHLIPRLQNNASPNQFNLEHLIPSRLPASLDTPTQPNFDFGPTPPVSKFDNQHATEQWVRQFLERRWDIETNNWISEETVGSGPESEPTFDNENGGSPSIKKHRTRRNNKTLNQQDFWSHFSQGQKEELGKMMASRYANPEAESHSPQGSGTSLRSGLGLSRWAAQPASPASQPPVDLSKKPLPSLPAQFVSQPVAPPRPRKKMLVKGKGVIISIARDIPRGTPGYPPKPMSPEAVEAKLRQYELERYNTQGFESWQDVGVVGETPSTQNRTIWPDDEYIRTTRSAAPNVRISPKEDWDAYMNHLVEAKLAALGVGLGGEEDTPSPMSRQASGQYPGLPFSPPLPTPSGGSHRGRQGSILSGSFPLGPSPGHMSRQSLASPAAFVNPRTNMHMHRHSTFSPASFLQHTASPTGAFSPGNYFGMQGARGGSPALPALPLSRPDLSGLASPSSPYGMRPNQQFPFPQAPKDDLLVQMQQQQQQLQAQLMQQQQMQQQQLQQQQQQLMGLRPSSTLAEVPEAESEEDELPLMKHATKNGPEIAVPSPQRGHRHNISANLERGARDAEYHLEEAIDKQFNEGGDFSTEPESTEELRPSKPVAESTWEGSRHILHQPQPHSRAHSLAKQQSKFSFGGASQENPRGDSDGAKTNISDVTNPSLEDGEIPETDNTAQHSKTASQVSNSWRDAKFALGKPSPALHSKHTSHSSISKLNVEAKEFKFNPAASFSPSLSSSFSSFTPALKSPVDGTSASNRTSLDGMSNMSVTAPSFKAVAPVFKPDVAPFKPTFDAPAFKPAVNAPSFKPSVPEFKPAVEAPVFKPTVPEFKPSNSLMPKSGFSFSSNGPAFTPDTPAITPGSAEFNPSVSVSSTSSNIFGNVNITADDIIKPAKRSKAVPIVRPDATRQRTPEKQAEEEEREDEEGRVANPEGREKRPRRGREDGDDVPKFALQPFLPSQALGELRQGRAATQSPAMEKEDVPEEKENVSPDAARVHSKSKSPEPLPLQEKKAPIVLSDPAAQAELSSDSKTPIDDLSAHESDAATPTVEGIPKPNLRKHKSSLSATARPFEFRPFAPSGGYDFGGIHITKPSVSQDNDPDKSQVGPPRFDSRSPATTFRPSDDGSFKTALESRRHAPYPESESVDFDNLGDASFNDIDAVMKHMNDEGSDFGIERDENSWVPSSPRRSVHEFERSDLPPSISKMRSDAPSPSPRRLYALRNINASSASAITGDPFDDDRAAYESPVHRLNNADEVPMSDWDEDILSEGEDKIQTRSTFFDTHVDDIIGRLLQNRLGPMQKNLQGIQDAIAMMSQRPGRGRRSLSTSERLDSDADDEDDEWGTDSHYRNRSPGKNRKMEKFRAIVKEALESHQPPATSLPVPVPEPVLPEKIRDIVAEALAAHQPHSASVDHMKPENVREVIMEALAHHQPQWTPPKHEPVPADQIRAIVEDAIAAHYTAPTESIKPEEIRSVVAEAIAAQTVKPSTEPLQPDDIRLIVMEAFETHAPPPPPMPVPEQIWPEDIKSIITEALEQKPVAEPLQPDAIRSIVEDVLVAHKQPSEPLQPETIRSIVTEALASHQPPAPPVLPIIQEPVQPDAIRAIVAEALAAHKPVPTLEAPIDIPQPQIDLSEIYQVIGSLKASIAQTTSHHLHAEDVRELIDDAFKRQNMEVAKREEVQAVQKRDERIEELEERLKEATFRYEAEAEARKALELREENSVRLLEVTEKELVLLKEQAADDETKIRVLEDEREISRRSLESIQAEEDEVRSKFAKLQVDHNELRLRAAAIEGAEYDAKKKLEAVTAENEALTYTLEEHRLSANKWRDDLKHAHDEAERMRMAIEQSRLQAEEATRVRESMRAKFEKVQHDVTVASGQAAAERVQWQKSDEEHMKKYEILSARIEAEGRTRERLERELERLEGQEREFMKLKFTLEQTQKYNARLEETVEQTRQESMDHKRAAERYEREFREAREAAHAEIRRMRTLMETDIDKANNQVNIVRHDLESEVARVRTELDNVRMDADTAKEKHELDLEAAADARRAAVGEALEKNTLALLEQQQAFERRLEAINLEHARVVEIAREDEERAVAFHNERIALADSKMDNLRDKIALLEEKLSVAKEAASAAASAAAAAAQNVKSPTAGSTSYASGAEKISPQALRESIAVLQEQLQERESRIESLEHKLAEADTDAPAKLKERDTEINWLRELLGVRIDDLSDLINALAQPAFDRESVRDAAIRIRTNLQMEQQEKERLITGGQKSLPTLSTLSNFASPKAVQIAAAFGNWRSKGRENAASALAGNSSSSASRNQTPSRPTPPTAQSFLSGLMTPPTSNLRRTPDLPTSSARPKPLLRTNSTSSRGSAAGFPSLGKQPVPSTPPLMRKASYDQDAEVERFSENGFYDDESTVDGDMTPIGLHFGQPLDR
ncbi:hypothetical protein P171DRAFT_429052 [Karstenula rhodostoma CBS 690.94]|uniref:Uncharacterized protein n=1 Tax=Karstenula rhodostoma CBS 690.94 TaxID=1392251 RepID=A0A9P4PNE3_9PLEO|nr:hypothetical protein P171DRAFT_429052 [Karstenula rhodostoma CBS 690.94]